MTLIEGRAKLIDHARCWIIAAASTSLCQPGPHERTTLPKIGRFAIFIIAAADNEVPSFKGSELNVNRLETAWSNLSQANLGVGMEDKQATGR